MENSLESVLKPVKRKLRWYQFSLRTLLIFVTLFAVACSWVAVKMGQAKRQREAIEAIRKAGGFVWYAEGDYSLNRTWGVDVLGVDFYANVEGASFDHRTNNPDETLKTITPYLVTFKTLTFLDLDKNPVTDKSIPVLLQLKNLDSLQLGGSTITDDGLAQLKDLPNLRRLSLVYADQITDEGIMHLKQFPKLRNIRFESHNPHITKNAWDVVKSFKDYDDLE